MNEKNTIWERAGKAGLVLGGISILYMLITALTKKLAVDGPSFILGLFNFLLWGAKLVGCVYLMRFFILRFAGEQPEADRSRALNFGVLTAFLSALLYSGVSFAYTSFIAPDMYTEAISLLQDNPMMDSNMLAALDEIAPKMPVYTFFGNLIYCFLFGTILAAIFSNRIAPKNPFAE